MMLLLDVHALVESWTVACDNSGCADILDPGERASDIGPWNQSEALSAAERRGWHITLDQHLCGPCATMPGVLHPEIEASA